ncbi:hypothetical protein C804_01140 [Lachnospiraceae bacterium A4]|nr:hypothetical protein C804_01140 [Lachnospiraceae bacterium A4]
MMNLNFVIKRYTYFKHTIFIVWCAYFFIECLFGFLIRYLAIYEYIEFVQVT